MIAENFEVLSDHCCFVVWAACAQGLLLLLFSSHMVCVKNASPPLFFRM